MDTRTRNVWIARLAASLQLGVMSCRDPEIEEFLNRGYGGRVGFIRAMTVIRQHIAAHPTAEVGHATLKRILYGGPKEDHFVQRLTARPLGNLRREYEATL